MPWLSGYEKSAPVRTGNAAADQFQLDFWGEVLDGLSLTRNAWLHDHDDSWDTQMALMDHLERIWQQPDLADPSGSCAKDLQGGSTTCSAEHLPALRLASGTPVCVISYLPVWSLGNAPAAMGTLKLHRRCISPLSVRRGQSGPPGHQRCIPQGRSDLPNADEQPRCSTRPVRWVRTSASAALN
jgi:hypothetical protein